MYPPNDPPRPSRPKAGLGLVIMMMIVIVVLFKVVVKSVNGTLEHIGASSFYIFLGAKSEELHQSPLFVWAALTSIAAYISSLALYKILKAR